MKSESLPNLKPLWLIALEAESLTLSHRHRSLGIDALAVGAMGIAAIWRRRAPLAFVGFVLACASGCFALLALCLRFAVERTRILDSLSVNAYSMYLLHYVFIVWLQYALLPIALFATGKAAIVFGITLALSWVAAVAFGNVSWDGHLAQAKRWLRASFSEPAPVNLVKQDDLPG